MKNRFKIRYILLAFGVLGTILLCGCKRTDVPEIGVTEQLQPEQTVADLTEQEEEKESDEAEAVPAPEKIEIQQQTSAEYEVWLASAMVFGLSMEYPDFELIDMYAASTVALEEKMDSQGVYIRFLSGGEELVVAGKPLDKERSEAGTRDLSCVTMGFASFDEVPVEGLKTEDMIPLALEDLEEPMSQLVLVSVYNH